MSDRKDNRGLFFTLLFIIGVLEANSQSNSVPLNQYTMKCYGVNDGLPQNSITDLAINTDGQLIVATYSGVVVFDGNRFSNLIPQTSKPFPNVEAFTLAVDLAGVIWIGTTSSGLYRVNGLDLMHWDTSNGLISHIIRKIKVIDTGVLVNNDGHVLYFENGDRPTLKSLSKTEDVSLSLISEFKDIGTRLIAVVDGDNSTPSITGYSLTNSEISRLKKGMFFWAKNGQVHQINDGKQQLIINDFRTQTPVSIYNLMYDSHQDLWISTIKNGLFRYGSKGLEAFDLLGTNRFSAVVEDEEGTLWLGTSSGLCSLSDGGVKNYGAEQGMFKENIKSLGTDNNNRIYAIPYGKNSQIISIENNQVTNQLLMPDSTGLNINQLTTDLQGQTWVITDDFIGVLNGDSITHFKDLESHSKVLIAHNNALWYQEHNSLVKLTGGSKEIFPIIQDTPVDIRSLSVSLTGDLLITEKHNFYRLNNESLIKINIPIGIGSCLREYDKGEIWGCSDGLWLRIEGENHHFDHNNGLTSVVNGHIHDVRKDQQGNLWAIANSGLFRLFRKDLDDYLSGKKPVPEFVKFSEQDSIKSSEFNSSSSSSVMTQDGKLWFSSQGGVVNVIPDLLFSESDKVLKPFIERIVVEDIHVDPYSTVELIANPKAIQIHFGAVHLSDNKNIRFRHQLLPLYNDWHSGRVANIAELPPGSYQLILQAQYNNNAWSAPFEKKFIVLPAWYQTWWFRVIFVLMVLFLLFVIPQWRLKRLNNNRKELKLLVKKQTESLIQANKKLDVLSRLDELTQIPNRREFINKINDMCKKPKSQFCLALIDIDDFKAYNDNYGHMSGDQCLKEVANLINESSDDSILVARFGGEEFVILFSGLNINQANDVLNKIHLKVADKQLTHQESKVKTYITLSSGLVSRKFNESVDSIIERADLAMYQAKTEGKDRIVIAG